MRRRGKVAVMIGKKRIGKVRAEICAAIVPAGRRFVVGPKWFLR
jgi:hypothetical protein